MGFRMQGLDKMQRELAGVQQALSALDGPLGELHFDAEDPGSIEQAVQEMHRIIDERVHPYAHNTLVAQLVALAKARFRESILERAAAARAKAAEEG